MTVLLAYIFLAVAVIMFGVQFFCNDRFAKDNGTDFIATFQFTFFQSLAGLLCLLVINGFRIDFAPFTLIMATLNSVNSLLYVYCSLKALSKINLSLYSVFAMLGGMLLPFLLGILIYSEKFTVGKGICLVLIASALALTVKKEDGKPYYGYYFGVFVLNGMSGVLATLFDRADFPKTDAAGYSVWTAITSAIISGVVLLFLLKKLRKLSFKSFLCTFGFGALNSVANYLLILALAVLDSSVQYPFVTGGVMIVSTVIAFISGQKPSLRDVLSVILAFGGVTVLVLIP